MILRLHDQTEIAAGIAALKQIDPDAMGKLVEAVGEPTLRRRPAGFAGLASIVVGQQLSTASANAIHGRLEAALHPLTATRLLETTDDLLRGCGLSTGKIRSLRAAAAACVAGRLDFDRLATFPAAMAHAELVAVPGIGPWTADVFLLFCLGHADVLPAGDLALQEAARLLLGLEQRPNARELAAVAGRWAPFRGVAAHLLWAYYRVKRGRVTP